MFFRKKKKKIDKQSTKTADLLVIRQLETDEDQVITTLASNLLGGAPLILNFDLLNVDAANKVIAFFSGVVYAIEGQIESINEKTFLFATKDAFLDGSLRGFVDQL